MSNCYIRIYEGPKDKGTNVIGLSRSASFACREVREFMTQKNYETYIYDLDSSEDRAIVEQIGSVSLLNMQIKPPLTDEDKQDLASWCSQNIDTGNGYGFLIDNRRNQQPIMPYYNRGQETVASW